MKNLHRYPSTVFRSLTFVKWGWFAFCFEIHTHLRGTYLNCCCREYMINRIQPIKKSYQFVHQSSLRLCLHATILHRRRSRLQVLPPSSMCQRTRSGDILSPHPSWDAHLRDSVASCVICCSAGAGVFGVVVAVVLVLVGVTSVLVLVGVGNWGCGRCACFLELETECLWNF